MVRLVQDMQAGDHPARPVLVASNDPNAAGLAKAAALGVPTAAVDHRAFKGDRSAFEAALLQPLLDARPDILWALNPVWATTSAGMSLRAPCFIASCSSRERPRRR